MQSNVGLSPGGQVSGQAKYMSRQEFTELFKRWYTTNNIHLDFSILRVGNRQVDPYELFTEAMKSGGSTVVSSYHALYCESILTYDDRFSVMICGMSSRSRWVGIGKACREQITSYRRCKLESI